MKTTSGVIIGATLIILWHVLGWPLLAWVLTRVEPETPEGWQPRMRTWRNGVEL